MWQRGNEIIFLGKGKKVENVEKMKKKATWYKNYWVKK